MILSDEVTEYEVNEYYDFEVYTAGKNNESKVLSVIWHARPSYNKNITLNSILYNWSNKNSLLSQHAPLAVTCKCKCNDSFYYSPILQFCTSYRIHRLFSFPTMTELNLLEFYINLWTLIKIHWRKNFSELLVLGMGNGHEIVIMQKRERER